MTIIYRGIMPGERKYTGTCLNCGSMYEAVEKELRYDPPSPVSGQGEEGRRFSACEVCSKIIYFNRMIP